ncbi:MAG: GNAT family N-acetyltransferase [Patescibacteria group bacterium]
MKMEETQIKIRPAVTTDAQEIVLLATQMENNTIAIPKIGKVLAGFLESGNEAVFVAEKDGNLLGCVSLYINWEILSGKQARIDIIVVDSNARGLGIGKLLMIRAEEWAEEQGSRTIKLSSNINRIESHQFYEKIGYKTTKDQRVFKKELKKL